MFAFIVTATQTRATLATDGVNLVDENNTRGVLFSVVEHVAHTRGTDADKHLHKVGTRDTEEWHLGLASNRLGQQGFAGARRANQQQAAGNTTTEFLELGRVFQKVDHFLHFFLGLIATGHVGKRHLVVVLVHHAGFAFTEAKWPAFATALHLPHEINPDADQEQHGAPAHQQGHQQRALFAGLDFKLHPVIDQVPDQATVQIGCNRADAGVIDTHRNNLGAALRLLNHSAFDLLAAHFV